MSDTDENDNVFIAEETLANNSAKQRQLEKEAHKFMRQNKKQMKTRPAVDNAKVRKIEEINLRG